MILSSFPKGMSQSKRKLSGVEIRQIYKKIPVVIHSDIELEKKLFLVDYGTDESSEEDPESNNRMILPIRSTDESSIKPPEGRICVGGDEVKTHDVGHQVYSETDDSDDGLSLPMKSQAESSIKQKDSDHRVCSENEDVSSQDLNTDANDSGNNIHLVISQDRDINCCISRSESTFSKYIVIPLVFFFIGYFLNDLDIIFEIPKYFDK